VFDDEPANTWPYDNGRCSGCGSRPASSGTIKLARLGLAQLFAAVPFSPDPLFGKLERCILLRAVRTNDKRGAEHLITRIVARHAERHAAGSLHETAAARGRDQ
jgi:hypothetical protein